MTAGSAASGPGVPRMAVAQRQVAGIVDAYSAAHPPAPLPDLLGALSVLTGRGILAFS